MKDNSSQLGMLEQRMIKETLCGHFNLSGKESTLTVTQKNTPGRHGGNRHYHFLIQNGAQRHRVFGKVSPYSEREYRNQQFVVENVPEKEMRIPRPVALIQLPDGLLFLQGYLEGYSHVFSSRDLRSLTLQRASAIESFGKNVLNTIYRLQQRFPVSYQALSAADTSGIPNQPKAVGVLQQLAEVRSLQNNTRKRLECRINGIAASGAVVRRGMIHGDLGMRNVMVKRSEISFIDWDFMQERGFSLLDPSYFAVILEMRGLQLFLSRRSVAKIDTLLFNHIKLLEGAVISETNMASIDAGIWFAKCLSLIDTLWWYEKEHVNNASTLLKQRGRQINFLASSLEREAVNEYD